MKILEGLHRLKIIFNVTEDIERFVYVYILTGKKAHLVDTGVSGAEAQIAGYLSTLGRSSKEIGSIFITHAHPDHIGSLHALKREADCIIYASKKEKNWIENIDAQYDERPVPNFYTLVNSSAQVDVTVADGDIFSPERGISIKVIETSGHSPGSLSFYWLEKQVLFTGDAVPVAGEVPIFVNINDSIASLKKIRALPDVAFYLPAWDNLLDSVAGKKNIDSGIASLQRIGSLVKDIASENAGLGKEEIFIATAQRLDLGEFVNNPLFRKSIYFTIDQNGRG